MKGIFMYLRGKTHANSSGNYHDGGEKYFAVELGAIFGVAVAGLN